MVSIEYLISRDSTNVGGLGAGTGGATKSILGTLDTTFSSYTYTDVSTGFFENASELFKKYSHKMLFKLFDVEKTPASQGYEENSYDLIIASNVLHATKSLQKTLENTRRLLKPGGYLLLLEITNNGPIRIGFITSGLPGWWTGVDDGRRFAPTVSPATWNNVLRKSGFSGVDALTPDCDGLAWPFSILAAQATDERVNFLRRPLSSVSRTTTIEELVILGQKSIETCRIAENVADLIRRYCSNITILDSLPTNADYIAPASTVLNLVDLDEPIFKHLSTESMDGLKRVFECSRNVLWVTHGCSGDEPYHMSSVGFGRSVSHEITQMRLQFLDLDSLEDSASRVITETLLRLHATEEWERDEGPLAELLWTTEPELVLQKDQLLVPRVLNNEDQNARLNSWRRPVTIDVAPQTSVVEICRAHDLFMLRHVPLQNSSKNGHELVNVKYSVLSALNVGPGNFMFVHIGTANQTGELVVGLSEANSSIVACRGGYVPIDVSPSQAPKLLSAITVELLARSIITGISSKSVLLVYEPDHTFASALARQAAAKGIQVQYITTSTETKDPAWISFHPLVSEYVIRKKLPKGVTHFVEIAVQGTTKDLVSRISTSLPLACKRIDSSALFRDQPSMSSNAENAVFKLLIDALSEARMNIFQHASNSVPIGHITNTAISKVPTTVIDWMADDVVTAQVQPFNPECMFSEDKTYLLVGLTGQIGQSLCEWMARNGTGCICLTSRNPDVDDEWLESFKDTGTIVKVFAM